MSNTPLIETAKLPGFETQQSAEEIALNKEYDEKGKNATPQKTEEMKQDFMRSIYGVSKKQEAQVDTESPNEDLDKMSERVMQLDEHPDYPLLKNIVDKGLIQQQEFSIIVDGFLNGSSFEESLAALGEINPDLQKKIQEVIDYSKLESTQKINKKHFQDDFQEDIGDETQRSPREIDALDLLGANYLILPFQNGERDRNVDIHHAFEATINSYVDGKEVTKNETYDKLMFEIKLPKKSFEERFSALVKLMDIIDTEQGKNGGKQSVAFKRQVERKRLNKESLKERFAEIQELVYASLEQKDNKAVEELSQELVEIKQETHSSGDIFTAGKIDLLLTEITNEKEQQV